MPHINHEILNGGKKALETLHAPHYYWKSVGNLKHAGLRIFLS